MSTGKHTVQELVVGDDNEACQQQSEAPPLPRAPTIN